jgi:hypothetical protein
MPVSEGTVDSRVGAAEQRDDRDSLRPGKVHRSCVRANEEFARQEKFAHFT